MRFGLAWLLIAAWLVGAAVGGPGPLLVLAIAFVALPVADAVVGVDRSTPPGRRALHDLLLRAWVPAQIVLIATAAALAPHRTAAEVLALAVGLGVVTGGGGITIAHELLHRRDARDRALAEVLMTSVSYPWFCVEHVLGHHRWVGTPRDPATARRGERVFTFVPRSVIGGLRSFLAIEAGKGPGRRLRYAAGVTAAWGLAAVLGGLPGLAVFAGQAAVAVGLLEAINYIEHYGLVRAPNAAGAYGPVTPRHSWNSDHAVSGAFLFQLPRHADHHAHAGKAFDELSSRDDAPTLPYGYPTLVLIALVPPLWFRWMDPRVDALRPAAEQRA